MPFETKFTASKDSIAFLSQAEVRERGWTTHLIKSFLKQPDRIGHGVYGCIIHLYALDRVASLEQTDEYQVAFQKAMIRRTAALDGHKRRLQREAEQERETARRRREAPTLDVPACSKDELEKLTNDHFIHGPLSTAYRIVNYLLERNSRHEGAYRRASSELGKSRGAQEYKAKLLDAIAERYPWLAEECLRRRDAEETWLQKRLRERNLSLKVYTRRVPRGERSELRWFVETGDNFDGTANGYGFRSEEKLYRTYAIFLAGHPERRLDLTGLSRGTLPEGPRLFSSINLPFRCGQLLIEWQCDFPCSAMRFIADLSVSSFE